MEILEVIRRWQAGDSRRRVAQSLGLARATVDKYVAAAAAMGLDILGDGPTESQVMALVGIGRPRVARAVPAQDPLAEQREQIERWLRVDRLRLTRIHELLGQGGVVVSYTTLRRYVVREGLGRVPVTTVRMAPTEPGEVAEMDFGKLGPLLDVGTGKRSTVWALIIVLPYSRHTFVYPLIRQTLDEVVAALEAAWWFFGGVPRRLVLDNFPAAVAAPDTLAPRMTSGFLEYSQARGFVADPARTRHPRDKPHVENAVDYVRNRFWKGGSFTDMDDVRRQARAWCTAVAGGRIHGTTRRQPLVVFTDEEQAALTPMSATPIGCEPYAVPIWRTATVAPDHHIQFAQALYSVPSTRCPPRTKLQIRGDRQIVRLYHGGALVKVHPRQPPGGRATDPDDYPVEKTAYTLRAPERLIRHACTLGDQTGAFATRLLSGPMPWATVRQAHKLLRLADRYTPKRLDDACGRALGFDLIDVRRVERILTLALEQEDARPPPDDARIVPRARFTRPASAFDHRQTVVVESAR